MKKAMINYIQAPKNDILYTPPYAVEPLLKHLRGYALSDIFSSWIWEPCDAGRSAISDGLRAMGKKVISSDIRTGTNFLEAAIPPGVKSIITNPPYSLKDDFIERCYELHLPWAMLMPLTALEGRRRGELFRKHGIYVLVLDGRVNFMSDKKSAWFNTSWFLWYPSLDGQSYIDFERLEVK